MLFDGIPSKYSIEHHGFFNVNKVYWNTASPRLVEKAVRRKEGYLSVDGALVVSTGDHTGRSPADKYIVRYPDQEDDIWWGKINQPISSESFDRIHERMLSFFQNRDIFVQDARVGAHPKHHLQIRIITEKAWHSLFSRNLFIPLKEYELTSATPAFTVIQSENFLVDPHKEKLNSETVIAIDFRKQIVLIGGTGYAGEIKKSIFTIMNYWLPRRNILSMHCSANVGTDDDVALFFGLSGTGKTTLSSDVHRKLIGDDEHGWSDDGVFNLEGGCYAKTIRLKEDLEPIIWNATHHFGTVLENVCLDAETRKLDLDSARFTENTRAAYPLSFIKNRIESGFSGQPQNIFFLSADAFGVLPPLSCLTPEQAMYYFLTGYTAKLAGTETGLGASPVATFSSCFGAPFLPLSPTRYAELLGEKISQNQVKVWLVNTGWTGGPFGVGTRIPLPVTRALINACLNGSMDETPFYQEPVFNLWIPQSCPEVPSELLDPRQNWADKMGYHRIAQTLIQKFKDNEEQFLTDVPANILDAGPQLLELPI